MEVEANLCLMPGDYAPHYSSACLASSFSALSVQKTAIFKIFPQMNVLKWPNEESER